MAAGKAKLKKQIQQLIDTDALWGFASEGDAEMTLTLPGGAAMDISIIEDMDGYNFLAVAIHSPMDN